MRFKFRKSAGVPVTPATYKRIALGNAARLRGEWTSAAGHYRDALALDPELHHIWIQLGHMLKEAKDAAGAETAYRRAIEVRPESSESWLHLGRLTKSRGNLQLATHCYQQAALTEPANADAMTELHRLLDHASRDEKRKIIEFLSNGPWAPRVSHAPLEKETATRRQSHPDNTAALVFDASDLIAFFAQARLPTGIQRVQIEAITAALHDPTREVRICCFIEGRDDWLEWPVDQFLSITGLAVRNGDRHDLEWIAALNGLRLTLALAEPFGFPSGAYLINLGTSWWLRNYFLHVRRAKAEYGIRYIPFVHDLIPIVMPGHCLPGLIRDFVTWALGVFDHADCFLANSEATKRDLLDVARALGKSVDPDEVAVIRLDADFRKVGAATLERSALGKWGLEREPFVLFVSTIESRKGHVVALDAWLDLIRRHGWRKTPRLVCVGKLGWLNDAVFKQLAGSNALRRRVTVLSDLSDEELSLLYRSCQFTIYPSLYEGWGLPVTEALCYGKAVVAADSASLPEAGGEFAAYVETGSAQALADAVEGMAFDSDLRRAWEEKIVVGFRPRDWRDIAHQIGHEAIRLAERAAEAGVARGLRPPKAKLGKWHPISTNLETRVWPGAGSGEVFRVGRGWLWPTGEGCWTRPEGGALAIGLPESRGPLWIDMLLWGLPEQACPWSIRVDGLPPLGGTLVAGEKKWISFGLSATDDSNVLHIHLAGQVSEMVRMNIGGLEEEYLASVGLAGFLIRETEDAARAALLTTAALGDLAEISAYAEHSTTADAEARKGPAD